MLPKRSRLTAREVEKVLTEGRIFRAPTLHMKYLAMPGSLRASAVVSKSTAKLAVKRNAARRALYLALSALPPPQKGGWAVFFVRRLPPSSMQSTFMSELAVLLKNFS
jgi:ribonuclease P protein component